MAAVRRVRRLRLRRFVRYEREPPPAHKPGAITEIPADLLPERPAAKPEPDDPALREYAYLAELARQDEPTNDDRSVSESTVTSAQASKTYIEAHT